ncbi:hypothetical protein GCM10009745_35860 [Kribbella yunnanensis]|uniref:Uncharacterized protein n=1 Tax=Kribbella yunnanensis TaxID=190194 RepID=A0ABN2HH30_9ACTN
MRKLISGVAATIAAGGMILGASALPSHAETTVTRQAASAVKFKTRYFDCYSSTGCLASAEVPSTWRFVQPTVYDYKFLGAGNQFVKFNNTIGGSDRTTAQEMKAKQKALKGTKGLHILSMATKKLKSNTGMGPLTASTIVYTYKSGKTTRWVATRYLGTYGYDQATNEITVAGSPNNAKFLGTVLARSTYSLYNGD